MPMHRIVELSILYYFGAPVVLISSLSMNLSQIAEANYRPAPRMESR